MGWVRLLGLVTSLCACIVEGAEVQAVALDAHGEHTCAILSDSSTKCWGRNEHGQLGNQDLSNRGSAPFEMGEALPRLDLGAGRTIVKLAGGVKHRCAILDKGDVKCWGTNTNGQLGYEDTNPRGIAPGQMGDNLPTVDLGTGLWAVDIALGGDHTCVVLDNGAVKCWGRGREGQIGSEREVNVGNAPGQMGDALPFVNLGIGRTAQKVSTGYIHTCVILDGGDLKCFGDNFLGELGQGDQVRRGAKPGQMGDALPTVNLGSGQKAVQVSCGQYHSCVKLQGGRLKCWGGANNGQVGLEKKGWIGAAFGTMGDDLPFVNLGTGRSPVDVKCAHSSTCVLLDNNQVKCWGMNSGAVGDGGGILGTGDTVQRGDDPGEMGDALPAVDFGSGRGAVGLTMGNSHGCALLTDGLTKCWGLNRYGQLGLENMQSYGGTPETIGEGLPPVAFGSALSTTTITSSTTTSRTTTATNTTTETSSTSTATTTTLTETSTMTTVSTSTQTNTSTTTTETTTTQPATITTTPVVTSTAEVTNTTTSTSTTITNTSTTTSPTTTAQQAANAENISLSDNTTNVTTATTTMVTNTSTSTTTTATNTSTSTTSTNTTTTMTTSYTTVTVTNTTTSTTTTTPPDLLGANDALADLSLNFTMAALPPGPVIVQDADSGGWAARSGIKPGDQLLAIDGKDVSTMSPTELYEALQKGPGTFQFQRNFVVGATVSQPGYSKLGFTLDGLPPGVVTIATVEPGGWADIAGLSEGDQLTSISGPDSVGQRRRLQGGLVGMTLDSFMRMLDVVRPLSFGVSRTTTASLGASVPTETPANKSNWDLFTGRDLLGFTVDNLPPNPVRIQMTGPDSWVATCGVLPGSQLVSINGQVVSQMAPDLFMQVLQQTRPIALSFVADAGGPVPSPGGQTISADRMAYTVTAQVSDLALGFSIGGIAPDTVRVAALDVGQWADRSGMVIGDELVAVNNVSVSEMTSDDLVSMLQDWRPLTLSLMPRRLDMPVANLSLWAQPADKPLYVLTAAPPDVKLGMSLAGVPPDPVVISSTEPGLWADANGVVRGDELVAINGVDISGTAPDEVIRLLQDERPLSLTFARAAKTFSVNSMDCSNFTALAVVQDYDLGLYVSPRTDTSTTVTAVGVEGGKWAARSGVALGDILQFLNGQNVTEMTDQDVMSTLLTLRPLAATFFRCSVQADTSDVNVSTIPVDKVRQPYAVSVGVDDMQLGLAISGSPPDPVRIASVRSGSWADQVGVVVGDALLSINSMPVMDMSLEQVVSLLQESRPLTLNFAPPDTSLDDGNATKPLLAIPIDNPVYQVTANSSNLLLGFSVDGVPPGPITVSAVDSDSWAATSGVGPGDELLSLNGQNVSSLSLSDFVQLLRFERPLAFTFSLAGGPLGVAWQGANFSSASCYEAMATPDDQALGLYLASMNQVLTVSAIERGQWAHKKGVAAGDVLRSINSVALASMQVQEVLQQLSVTRPLRLSFCSPPPPDPPSMSMPVDLLRGPYSLNLAAMDSKLGFSLGGMPPSCTRIAAVNTGEWADRSGVLIGDELASVDGTQVSNMSLEALVDVLRNGRPSVLGFVPRLFSACPSDANLLAAWPVDKLEYNMSATTQDVQLGFYISGTPPGSVLVTATVPGSLAERSGVKVADELKSVNGRDLSLMDAAELVGHLRNIRPLSLWFTASEPGTMLAKLAGNPGVMSCDSYTVSAKPTDAELGLFVGGIFTFGAPVVGVEIGLPAQRLGILAGDILAGVNGLSVASMQQMELVNQLQNTRPLSLGMSRCSPSFPPIPVDKQIRLGYYANATVNDLALGLSLHGLPPYRVRAGAVPVRAWADQAGVMAGDELLTINGQQVSSMTADELIRTLQVTRPLSLYFLPRPQNSTISAWGYGWDPDLRVMPVDYANQSIYTVNSTQPGEKLGLYVFGMPPESVSVGSVAPLAWADMVGVATGDMLQSVNGQDISKMSVDEFVGILKDTRPLVVTLSRDPSVWDSPGPGAAGAQDCPAFPALASETDAELGLFISSAEDKVGLIVGVEPDQWAENSAMMAGDTITQVNAQDVAGMTVQQLAAALQVRPLSVVFGYCAPVLVGAPSEYYTANATASDLLGFLPIQAFDTTDIFVASVAANSWADQAQVAPGDQLLLLNGVDVSMLSPDELMRQLKFSRPLSLYFLRGDGLGQPGSIATGASQDCTNYSAFATQRADLGMTVLVTSEGTMYIVSVTQGLWAQRAGMTAGDTLQTVNGRGAAEMSQLEWDFHMTVIRPLIIAFSRCTSQGGLPPGVITGGGTGAPGDSGDGQQPPAPATVPVSCVATEADSSLGFSLSSSPGQVLVATIESGSWGEDCGLLVGDLLVAVNGSNVSLLSSGELDVLLASGRPLAIDFVRAVQLPTDPPDTGGGSGGGATGGSGEAGGGSTSGQTSQDGSPAIDPADTYTVVATPQDGALGFQLVDRPPKPVRIMVGGGQWAARSGITSGDVLLTINGVNASAMTNEALVWTLLNSRPLSLVFAKGEPILANGTQSPPQYPGTPGDGFAWPWLQSTTLLPSTVEDPEGGEVLISSATLPNVLIPYLIGLLLLLAAL